MIIGKNNTRFLLEQLILFIKINQEDSNFDSFKVYFQILKSFLMDPKVKIEERYLTDIFLLIGNIIEKVHPKNACFCWLFLVLEFWDCAW